MDTNSLIPVYTALGGILIGAIASFFPAFILERMKRKTEIEAVTGEIITEISVTLFLIEKRKYLEHIDNVLTALRAGKVPITTFHVMFPNDYCPIYRSHLGKLGLIPPGIREDVVTFYQLLAAIVFDMRPAVQPTAHHRGEAEFAELHEITSETIRTGRRILSIHPPKSRK